jgi:hypothetical protein
MSRFFAEVATEVSKFFGAFDESSFNSATVAKGTLSRAFITKVGMNLRGISSSKPRT